MSFFPKTKFKFNKKIAIVLVILVLVASLLGNFYNLYSKWVTKDRTNYRAVGELNMRELIYDTAVRDGKVDVGSMDKNAKVITLYLTCPE